MVLHFGGEDFVAGVDVGSGPGVGDEVYALGGSADVDEVFGGGGADEAGDFLAGFLVALGGLHAEGMDAAVDVGVVAFVVVDEGLDDGGGLLGGGGVVEVDEGLAVDKLVQNGEVFSYFLDV